MTKDFELVNFTNEESDIIMNDLDIHYEPIFIQDELKNTHYYNSRYYEYYYNKNQNNYAIQIFKAQENGILLYCLSEYGLVCRSENYINPIEFKQNICFRSFERLVLYLEHVYMKD